MSCGRLRQRGAARIGGFHQAASGLVDIPLAIRLAGNAARSLGLVDGGVADANAACSLAGGGGQ